jgi:Tol biopolymer transport system component
VFSRLSPGIFVIRLDGSGLGRLTSNRGDRHPVWSPDGTRIAFLRGGLWVMRADGTREHRLRRAPLPAGAPSWTADGRSLVVPSDGEFLKVDAKTGRVLRRLKPTYDSTLPDPEATLSPNGRMLAYVDRRPEPPGCERTECEVFAL